MNIAPVNNVNKIGLSDLAILMLEHRWIFCACMIGFCLAGLAAPGLFAPRYCASAVIMKPLSQKNTDLSYFAGKNKRLAEILRTIAAGTGGSKRFLGILSSRGLADNVIARYGLAHVYCFDKRQKYYIEDVIKRYSKNVETAEDHLGNIMIAVTDRDPVRAAAMANYIVYQLDTISRRLPGKAPGIRASTSKTGSAK